MSFLQDQIRAASQKYYQDGTSDISDQEFDKMLSVLKEREPNSDLLNAGHGYSVDLDTTQGQKVKHKYGTIGSLDKCHNWSEIPKNISSLSSVCASLKLDGMSVVMYYEKGHLVQALTRGVSNIGIDITAKVKLILGKSVSIDSRFTGAVRGEALMSYENFNYYQQLHPEAMNARNTAVGLMKSNTISEDLPLVDIVVYTIVGLESEDLQPLLATYGDMHSFLTHNFTLVCPYQKVELSEQSLLDKMECLRASWYDEYPADGIVLTDSQVTLVDQEVIYNAIAFKFKAESAVTKVIGVEWNLSRTKYLIPRIQLETVQLSGTSVSWCAGHNALYIKDSQIGVGAEVEIYKSGEVIPYLDKVIRPADTVTLPICCPCCHERLKFKGVHLMCTNPACTDADLQDALVWMDNIAPTDGLGDTLKLEFLSQIFGEKVSIDLIYQIGDVARTISKGVKLNLFYQLLHRLFTSKVKLSDAIRALNIPRFGEVTAFKLAEYPELVELLMYGQLQEVENNSTEWAYKIGVSNYKSLIEHANKVKRLRYIRNNIIWTPAVKSTGDKVAITGKLSIKRSDFEKELKSFGYIPGNISKDTKFLITDDPTSRTEKNKKADSWGITKITETEFRSHYLK